MLSWTKSVLLSRGGLKFARFSALNSSARNWMLAASERLLSRKFLKRKHQDRRDPVRSVGCDQNSQAG